MERGIVSAWLDNTADAPNAMWRINRFPHIVSARQQRGEEAMRIAYLAAMAALTLSIGIPAS